MSKRLAGTGEAFASIFFQGAVCQALVVIIALAATFSTLRPVIVSFLKNGSSLNYLANSKPDGLTMGFTNIPSILGRYLDPSKKAGFTRASFTPIGSFATNAVVIAVKKNSPYQTLEDLITAIKAKPGEITIGTDSRGGDDHVNIRLIEKKLGLQMNIVHYNSGADKVASRGSWAGAV